MHLSGAMSWGGVPVRYHVWGGRGGGEYLSGAKSGGITLAYGVTPPHPKNFRNHLWKTNKICKLLKIAFYFFQIYLSQKPECLHFDSE